MLRPIDGREVGDFVEVCEPKIHPRYAFTAKIAGVYSPFSELLCGDDDYWYDVRTRFGKTASQHRVPSSAITAMKPYDADTRVMCDVGPSLNSKLMPCMVEKQVAAPATRRRMVVKWRCLSFTP